MLATIRTWNQNRRDRRAARDRYDQHAWLLGSLLWSDEDYNNPEVRIANLEEMAFTAGAMARECLIFDNNRTCDDGYTPAQWHQLEASLFLLLEAAEKRDYSVIDLDEDAARLYRDHKVKSIIGCIAEDDDLTEKAFDLLALHDEVSPVVGSQASEVLAVLADVYLMCSGMDREDARVLVWGKAETRWTDHDWIKPGAEVIIGYHYSTNPIAVTKTTIDTVAVKSFKVVGVDERFKMETQKTMTKGGAWSLRYYEAHHPASERAQELVAESAQRARVSKAEHAVRKWQRNHTEENRAATVAALQELED